MTNTAPMQDAAADPVLTIDTNDLREWLSEIKVYKNSCDHMDLLCKQSMAKAGRTATYDALNTARAAVHIRTDEMIEITRKLGGLLLIGGAA